MSPARCFSNKSFSERIQEKEICSVVVYSTFLHRTFHYKSKVLDHFGSKKPALNVCILITTRTVNSGISVSIYHEHVSFVLAIGSMLQYLWLLFCIFLTLCMRNSCRRIILNILLYWRLLGDGDLSIKHVGWFVFLGNIILLLRLEQSVVRSFANSTEFSPNVGLTSYRL